MSRKKKKVAHPGDTFFAKVPPRRNVELKRAENGYVVSSCGHPDGEEKLYIAKSKNEAAKHVKKCLLIADEKA